jgi:hypothetical protein
MSTEIDSKPFDDLRALAHRLDLRLGTEKRKLILAGHERLSLATTAQDWASWNQGVEARLKTVAGVEQADNLLFRLK